MRLIRFELKKVFFNKFFIGMVAVTLVLNLFFLYENGKADNIGSTSNYDTYDEFVDSVQANAEKSLSTSVFSENLSEFSKKNIQKTADDFETMRGIEITEDINVGVLTVLNSEMSDLCILLVLISVGLSLIIDEKEKQLFNFIRSTKNGTISTIFAKLVTSFICCLFINALITSSNSAFAFCTYGFGDVFRSIQSVPELLTCFLRLNVIEFFLLFFIIKTIGIFIIGTVVFLFCLVLKRAISMLVVVSLISAGSFSLTFISETSNLNFFRYINLYSLLNPYRIFSSYTNLNIFGEPINVIIVFALFAFLTALVTLSIVIVYYLKKRPLENSDRKTRKALFSSKTHYSLTYFELKKLLSLNKVTAIILIFAILQIYFVYKQVNFQSSEDYYYQYYMEMLNGSLTEYKEKIILEEKAKIDETEEKLNILNEQRQNGELSLQEFIHSQEQYSDALDKSDMFNQVYEKYLYIKDHPKAEFIYDSGYEKLFGISDKNFSVVNTMLLLSAFAMCFCAVYSTEYKNSMYKILSTTKYGVNKTIYIKSKIIVCITALLFVIAYLPELIYIQRFYGFTNLNAPLISIPALFGLGEMPIWNAIAFLYLLRFAIMLMLIPIISAVSLKSKNNIITAIIGIIIFVVPIFVYYTMNVKLLETHSLWNLLSGRVLISGSSVPLFVIQLILLATLSLISSMFIHRKFPKMIYNNKSSHIKWRQKNSI